MKLAIIGDVHKAWDDADVDYFDESTYDALLFVGDLPGHTHRGVEDIARRIARVRKPIYFMPGNHDGVSISQFAGELRQNEKWIEKFANHQHGLVDKLKTALGPAIYTGYSRHTLEYGGVRVDMVAARPHSMGGPTLAFRPYLKEKFGINSIEDSATRLKALFDECQGPIIVFSHNGPAGLGSERDSIWGCDFMKEGGDFGDPDLQIALDHARASGKQILAVIAGHMHHKLKGNGMRRWFLRDENGTAYINAARVPRIFKMIGTKHYHHISLKTDGRGAFVEEVLMAEHGDVRNPAF